MSLYKICSKKLLIHILNLVIFTKCVNSRNVPNIPFHSSDTPVSETSKVPHNLDSNDFLQGDASALVSQISNGPFYPVNTPANINHQTAQPDNNDNVAYGSRIVLGIVENVKETETPELAEDQAKSQTIVKYFDQEDYNGLKKNPIVVADIYDEAENDQGNRIRNRKETLALEQEESPIKPDSDTNAKNTKLNVNGDEKELNEGSKTDNAMEEKENESLKESEENKLLRWNNEYDSIKNGGGNSEVEENEENEENESTREEEEKENIQIDDENQNIKNDETLKEEAVNESIKEHEENQSVKEDPVNENIKEDEENEGIEVEEDNESIKEDEDNQSIGEDEENENITENEEYRENPIHNESIKDDEDYKESPSYTDNSESLANIEDEHPHEDDKYESEKIKAPLTAAHRENSNEDHKTEQYWNPYTESNREKEEINIDNKENANIGIQKESPQKYDVNEDAKSEQLSEKHSDQKGDTNVPDKASISDKDEAHSNEVKNAESTHADAKAANKNVKHSSGTGKEHHSHKYGHKGEKGLKGYKGHHEEIKSSKGHNDKEHHGKKYADEKGLEGKHHEEREHHGEHHKGEKGEKDSDYSEDGKHSKGHSTNGEHNIHKKDEYNKKEIFYDEHHEGGEHDKHGGFEFDDHFEKGGFKKGSHHKKGDHEDHFGKESHHKKGSHYNEKKGHKKAAGQDKHHHHHSKHGKKKDTSGKKHWSYEKGTGGQGGKKKYTVDPQEAHSTPQHIRRTPSNLSNNKAGNNAEYTNDQIDHGTATHHKIKDIAKAETIKINQEKVLDGTRNSKYGGSEASAIEIKKEEIPFNSKNNYYSNNQSLVNSNSPKKNYFASAPNGKFDYESEEGSSNLNQEEDRDKETILNEDEKETSEIEIKKEEIPVNSKYNYYNDRENPEKPNSPKQKKSNWHIIGKFDSDEGQSNSKGEDKELTNASEKRKIYVIIPENFDEQFQPNKKYSDIEPSPSKKNFKSKKISELSEEESFPEEHRKSLSEIDSVVHTIGENVKNKRMSPVYNNIKKLKVDKPRKFSIDRSST